MYYVLLYWKTNFYLEFHKRPEKGGFFCYFCSLLDKTFLPHFLQTRPLGKLFVPHPSHMIKSRTKKKTWLNLASAWMDGEWGGLLVTQTQATKLEWLSSSKLRKHFTWLSHVRIFNRRVKGNKKAETFTLPLHVRPIDISDEKGSIRQAKKRLRVAFSLWWHLAGEWIFLPQLNGMAGNPIRANLLRNRRTVKVCNKRNLAAWLDLLLSRLIF